MELVGQRCATTAPTPNPNGDASVQFARGRVTFEYIGHATVKVRLFARRGLKSFLQGDPLIGEAVLSTDHELTCDCREKEIVLPLTHKHDEAGACSVKLHLKLEQIGSMVTDELKMSLSS